MGEARYLCSDSVMTSMTVTCKKQLFSELAAKGAELTGLDQRLVLKALSERERLGPTALGGGIAIPHARLSELDEIHGLFVQLDRPIEYEAMDGEPIDLVFMLLAPEQDNADHLKALAWVSRNLRDKGLCSRLRGAEGKDAILALFAAGPQRDAA
ncbi:MAG: PTS IIA-like nitrogen regulatory protein PtsN [Alphaproteobacteria bacterium]